MCVIVRGGGGVCGSDLLDEVLVRVEYGESEVFLSERCLWCIIRNLTEVIPSGAERDEVVVRVR